MAYSSLNYEKALAGFGDEDTTMLMISAFDETNLNQTVADLHDGIMRMNFKDIRGSIHKVRGTFSYIAADKAVSIALQMRESAHKMDSDKILREYLRFLEECKQLKKHLAVVLNKTANIQDFEIWEEETKRKYFSKSIEITGHDVAQNGVCCTGCNIF